MIYLICFLLSALLLHGASKKINRISGKILFILAALLPILLATFRSAEVGIDVHVYVQPYVRRALNASSFASYFNNMLTSGVEIGYIFLNYIGAVWLGGLSGVFFLSMLLTIVPVYIRIVGDEDEIPVWVATSIYLFIFYNLSLNLTRQAIALSIVFYAIKYVEDNRWKSFALLIVIALLFHNSALIGLIYVVLLKISQGKNWRLKQISILFLLLIFIVFYNSIFPIIVNLLFSNNADKYLNAFLSDGTGYLSLWMIVINAFAIICVLFSKKYLLKTNYYKHYILIVTFNFAIYLLTIYNGNCFRYALYFTIMLPRLVPAVRYRFKQNSRIIADILIVIVFMLYWTNFNLISDSYGTVPYYMN